MANIVGPCNAWSDRNYYFVVFITSLSVCHRVEVRYIIHLYCLAVQACFYSDLVELKRPGFDHCPGHGDIFKSL